MPQDLTILLLLPFFLFSCGGDNFDETAFPPDQQSVELAFKRMADHGELEPVLEIRQMIDGWQFYVGSSQEGSVMDGPKTKTVWLKDRSGIEYKVTSLTSPDVIDKLEIGTYGFARGRIHGVERDLAAGELKAELLLSDWTAREY